VIITHDLGTLWLMADRVMVMHLGRVPPRRSTARPRIPTPRR
jgi:ABC-type dipeptide/oligopeptide/nickel transport system ATPase component